MSLNYGPVFRRLWTKVHQITSADRSLQRLFPIVGILFRSGDIHDRSVRLRTRPKSRQKKHVCRPQIFGEDPKFWT